MLFLVLVFSIDLPGKSWTWIAEPIKALGVSGEDGYNFNKI